MQIQIAPTAFFPAELNPYLLLQCCFITLTLTTELNSLSESVIDDCCLLTTFKHHRT